MTERTRREGNFDIITIRVRTSCSSLSCQRQPGMISPLPWLLPQLLSSLHALRQLLLQLFRNVNNYCTDETNLTEYSSFTFTSDLSYLKSLYTKNRTNNAVGCSEILQKPCHTNFEGIDQTVEEDPQD